MTAMATTVFVRWMYSGISRRRLILILLTLCCLGILAYVSFILGKRQSPTPTIKIRTEFIDAAMYPRRHLYYVANDAPSSANVSIFHSSQTDCKHKAQLQVPGSGSVVICTYDPKADIFISTSLHENGEWEYSMVEAIEYLLQLDKGVRYASTDTETGQRMNTSVHSTSNAQENTFIHSIEDQTLSMLDLGSNIGVFTLSVAKMGHQVLAVDAMQESLQLLATSLLLNGFSERVMLLNNAVSNERGLVNLEVNYENKGGSYIKGESSNKINSTSNLNARRQISAICLDDLIRYVRTGRVLIKMDIEGFEARALQCAISFFDKITVPFVFMEWIFHSNNFNGVFIIDFMASRNFLPYAHPADKIPLNPSNYISWPGNVFWMKRH